MIRFQITGNGFLYNMVRIIVGTLMEIGKGTWPPEYMETLLEACDRTKAGPTARPEGLTLLRIQYPEWQNLDKKQKKELTLENPYNIINKCDIE